MRVWVVLAVAAVMISCNGARVSEPVVIRDVEAVVVSEPLRRAQIDVVLVVCSSGMEQALRGERPPFVKVSVADKKEAAGIEPGDTVHFDLNVDWNFVDAWATHLRKVRAGKAGAGFEGCPK